MTSRQRLGAWGTPPSQDTTPPAVPLFVYGTLRTGELLDDGRLGDTFERSLAYVRGYIYTNTEGDWPLLVPSRPGWVVGEVVLADASPNSPLWQALGENELAWGYELRFLDVHDAIDSESTGKALACVWPWAEQLGAQIISGDWLKRGHSNG